MYEYLARLWINILVTDVTKMSIPRHDVVDSINAAANATINHDLYTVLSSQLK
jgi:hypothetical protein